MPGHYDVIVVGLGAMGAATAWHLAKRGKRVLGLEQFEFNHSLGSSHGDSRIIRLSYFEHPNYVPLLLRAYENWRVLEHDAETELLFEIGGLYIGSADGEFIAGSLRAAKQFDLPHDELTLEQMRARFPMLRSPGNMVGLYEPRAGFVLAEATVKASLHAAAKFGAELRERCAVIEWEANGGGVSVTTEQGVFHAERLILAAGPWSNRVIGDLGVALSVTRQVMGWFAPNASQSFTLGRFPVWAIEDGLGGLAYGFPTMPFGRPGMKVARHQPGQDADPALLDRTLNPGDLEELETIVRTMFTDEPARWLSHAVCMYTMTPDNHFVIDKHPAYEHVLVACGFSGHGFKFVSVIGEILADLACSGRSELPCEFLSLRRFR